MKNTGVPVTLALFTLLVCGLAPARVWAQDIISTAIGGGPNGIPSVQADLNDPVGMTVDTSGNYYLTTCNGNRVYKVSNAGVITVIAGTGVANYSGDGVAGGARNATLNCPVGVAVDATGNVYVSDFNNQVIRKIDTARTITTIAGVVGNCNYNGDGSPATNFHLCRPQGLAIDAANNIYIADSNNYRIRKLVLGTSTISTFAGTGGGGYNGDGEPATSATLNVPIGVALDNGGDLFIADTNNYRIREVTVSSGIISTVAGTGINGFSGDTGPATSAAISQVFTAIAVNGAGTLVTIGDSNNNERIRQFTVGGTINTVAGTGSASFCGDAGPATSACLHQPYGLAVTHSGLIYVADRSNNRIRAFSVGSTINTVAGNGDIKFPTLVSGVPPSGVVFNTPVGVLADPAGNVFVSDYYNCMVRESVKATGVVNIFAGSAAPNATTGTCGFSGVGGLATSAQLGNINDVARDSSGNIFFADGSNCVIWQVSAATGDISVFAGLGPPRSCGFSGDGGPATSAQLNNPEGLFIDGKNRVYVGDFNNNRVRMISNGVITTVAGSGGYGYTGDGAPATLAELRNPDGVSVDLEGNLYIADYNNCVVREVMGSTGIINTIAGNGNCTFNGDGPAIDHELNRPQSVTVDPNNNLFIADTNNQRVRWVNPSGNMTTIAGNGIAGLIGDGGSALTAEFNFPSRVAIDTNGNYLITDQNNLRVREVTAFPALNVSPTSLNFGLRTVGSSGSPEVIELSALGSLTFGSITVTGPFTEYDDCGSGLTNAETCEMYVFYTPTAAGTQTGSIIIQDNGYFNPTTVIPLQGTGSVIAVTGGPLQFGNQAVKTTSAAKTVTVTNKGSAAITFGTVTVNDADFVIGSTTCPAAGSRLAAGASCAINVVFRPRSTGSKKGALIIADSDPSSPQIVGLSGTGTSLVVFTPASLTFAPQSVGTTSSPMKITLTNKTGVALTLGNPALTVTGPFVVVPGITTCTKSLVIAATGTCSIYIEFAPPTADYLNGTLSVTDSDATSPQTVALSGIGTAIAFTPATVSLSNTVGHEASTTVTIANLGPTAITLTAWTITGPNAKDFAANLAEPPCGGLIAAGSSCMFTLYFTPSLVGSESASLLLYDNNPGSPQALPLNGTGQ